MLYNIYAGMGGSFGGASYRYTSDFNTEDEAEQTAYTEAWDIYESYAGLYGIQTFEDAINDALESGEFDEDTPETDPDLVDYANDLYQEYINNWISSFAISTDKDINTERLKKDGEFHLI